MIRYKQKLILIFSCFSSFIITACAVPYARVYVDNSSCTKSISNGMVKIISKDWDKNTVKESDNLYVANIIDMVITPKVINKEINYLDFTAKGINYYFLFQADNNNVCWLRLFQKKGKNSDYYNTMTFIESEPIEGCKCGNNELNFGLTL